MKQKLSKYLNPMDFSSSIEKEIGSIDFDATSLNPSRRKEKLFLRNFTSDGLYTIMKKVGLVQHLEKKGFKGLTVDIDIDDAYIHYMKLYCDKTPEPECLLIDLRLSESRFLPDKRFFEDQQQAVYDMIVIEWLSAQDPRGVFRKDKPQLPGQGKPGLGVLNFCFEMMYIVAREVIKDGFLDIPEHMHGAIMYSRKFKFFDPAHEAIIRAIMRDLDGYSLSDISWGIMTQTIIEEHKNAPQVYAPSEQIFYVSDRMRDYYHSKKYLSVYNKYYRLKRYRFEYDEMVKRRQAFLASKGTPGPAAGP